MKKIYAQKKLFIFLNLFSFFFGVIGLYGGFTTDKSMFYLLFVSLGLSILSLLFLINKICYNDEEIRFSFIYRKATVDDLNRIWDKDIANHPNDDRWKRWKDRYIKDNEENKCATFVVLTDDKPIGQITVLYSPECGSVAGRPLLCNGKDIANMNAFRIEKAYEGQGHISKLVKMAKDLSAGVVLIAALTSLLIGFMLFGRKILIMYLY